MCVCVKVPLQRPSFQNKFLDKIARIKFLEFITWKKDVHCYLLGILNLKSQKHAMNYQTEQEFREILKQSQRNDCEVYVLAHFGQLRTG